MTSTTTVFDSNRTADVDALPNGVALYKAQRNAAGQLTDFRLHQLNTVALLAWQRPEADLIGRSVNQLFPEAEADFLIQQFAVVLNTGRTVQFGMSYGGPETGVAASDYEVRVEKHDDCVRVSYGNITARKQAETQARQQAERQDNVLMRVVENGKAGMTLFDLIRNETGAITDFRYVFTNAVNARNTGRSVADMTGNTLLTLLPGIAQTEWYGRLLNTATTGQPNSFLFGYEAENIRGWFDTSFVKIGDDQVLFTDLNVTPLKDAEVAAQKNADLLAVKNRELKRTNENLRSFTYIASHDLQEPLRKLTSFADILNTQYAGQFDAGAADIVQRMNTAAERMRLLIQDLLIYSRVETQPGSYKLVNLNTLIEELQENELWAALRQSNAQLRFEGLPTLTADPSQMRQLFQNLLSNAIKFSRPGVVPAITISSRMIARADVPAGLLSPAKAG